MWVDNFNMEISAYFILAVPAASSVFKLPIATKLTGSPAGLIGRLPEHFVKIAPVVLEPYIHTSIFT